jgi:hypothetical protein
MSLKTMREAVEGGQLGEQAKKASQEQVDMARMFNKVFSTTEGKLVLEHLDLYSHKNFPNYDNVYATYSKIGEQTLVDYIGKLIRTSKKE